MNVLIVDDEPLARARLRQQISGLEGFEVVGEAANGLQAIELVSTARPDIVLLDIRMPGMDGLEVGRHLFELGQPPAIIFTTAYGEYALKAFEVHAVDYLLKPVRQERLQEALRAAHKLTRSQIQAVTQENEGTRTHICVRVRGNLKLIDVASIYYFKADSKYVEIRHDEGQALIEESLKSLEEEFGGCFLRVHRNALVSPGRLQSLEKGDDGHHAISFRGIDDRLEVSRRHLPRVRALLKS